MKVKNNLIFTKGQKYNESFRSGAADSRKETFEMAHQVIWTKRTLETFIREANLTEEEEWIMRTRAAGWSRVKQSEKLHISISCLDKKIKKLKLMYDEVQKYNPELSPRKFSPEELWEETRR